MAGLAHQRDSPMDKQEELRARDRVHQVGIENRGKMKTKDSKRKWMWWFLGVVLALQLYFVRELVAARRASKRRTGRP